MTDGRHYSLRTLFLVIAIWGVVLGTGKLPLAIFLLITFLAVSIAIILGPLRLGLDAVDRLAMRLKRDRYD